MASLSAVQLSPLVAAPPHHLKKRLSITSHSSSSCTPSSSSNSSSISLDAVDARSSNLGILQHREHSWRQRYGFREHSTFMGEECLGMRGRSSSHVIYARKQGKKSTNGGLVQAVEEVRVPEQDEEPENMFMGKKLDGYEPNFWEGEKWNLFGFLLQYLWAFGILIALVACAVAVASYNSGAVDIRTTSVFKDALENPVEIDSSLESGNDVNPLE